jgi:hypothetical protein
MAKLKLGAIADDKPVKLTVELPADVHGDLRAYTDMLAAKPGSRSQIRQTWSHQCWRDSWQPTEPLQRPAARISPRKARDSAHSII